MDVAQNAASTITLSLVVAAETRNFFTFNLPPVSEIQHSDKYYDPRDIRSGEILGASLALGVGFAVAVLAKDPLPLVMSGLISAGMIASYEHAIRHPAAPATTATTTIA